MSAKALAVFSTSAGTVPSSLLAGTTTETSGALDPVTGAVPICACSHHAKPGVTQTTPGDDRTPKSPENAGLQESDGLADTPNDRRSPWTVFSESGCNLSWRSMVDRVELAQPAPNRRRLVVRLALFAFCGGLLLLLSSRPAEAAERREPGLLDPVSATLEATAREVQLAGRATGSWTSTVGKAADAARQAVAPHPRPTPSAARPPATRPVRRGAPAVTSPVRRVAPPTRSATSKASSGPVGRVAKLTSGPVGRVAKVASTVTGRASGPVGRVTEAGGRVLAPVAQVTAPVAEAVGPVTGAVVGPLGPVLAPVGPALVPVAGAVGGLVSPVVPGGLLPLPGLPGSGTGSPGGPGSQGPAATSTGVDGTAPAATLPGRFADDSGPSGRRRRQLARCPVHPVLAGPDRRGEPARLPGVGRAPRGRAGPLVDLLGRRVRPCRAHRRPAPPRPQRPWTRPPRPVGRPLALLPPGRLSRLATSGDVLHVLQL